MAKLLSGQYEVLKTEVLQAILSVKQNINSKMDVSKKYSFNSKLTTLAKKLTPQERNNVIQFYEVANKATTDFGRGYLVRKCLKIN